MEKSSMNFEKNLEMLNLIIQKLESGDLNLDESIKEYEKAMKLIKKSSEILNRAEGKIFKINEENKGIEIEEIE